MPSNPPRLRSHRPGRRRRSVRDLPPVLAILIAANVLVEAVLFLSDVGVFTPRLRSWAYQNGGFWSGLLSNWKPNYPFQPYLMFATYAFLHSGLAHLLVNMVTLFSFGRAIIARIGQARFLVLYMFSAIGGALGFGVLSDMAIPMVGASGALFGLAGAWMAWDYVDRYAAATGIWPVARAALILVLLNVVLYWAMNGMLAWQTHLGGFVAGWIIALLIDPTSRPRLEQARATGDREARQRPQRPHRAADHAD